MKPANPWRSLILGEVLDVENFAIVPESGVSYKYLGLEHIEQQTGREFSIRQRQTDRPFKVRSSSSLPYMSCMES